MRVKKIRVKNFRNIEECDIDFSDGVNLLYGNNAQGKTNIVEAIYIFSRGKSFRGRDDSELIRFGEEGFNLFIEFESNIGKENLEYSLYGKERKRKKNGYNIKKVSEMIGSFKSVLFYPDDLGLVKDGPDKRREFVNIASSQCYSSYLKNYSDFKKALENRNCLLKMINKGFYVDIKEIESWSESLAEYASFIYISRIEFIKKLGFYANKFMNEISGGKEIIKIYLDSDIDEDCEREKAKEIYKDKLKSNLDKEIAAGVTLYGPHRDDIKILINEKEARIFASQGQQRSIVLSMKLAEGEVIKEISGEYPVYLFDDVLSELDDERRKYILSGVKDKQLIITSCSRDESEGFTDREIDVRQGKFEIRE
ncbi:MAG: DNA replication/repair protein RecF [Clostridia bacterium]|nr:DNA replication/repair protein RecF [Clostridia bacterium]